MQDGLTDEEKLLIDDLLYLGIKNLSQLETVVGLPFLVSPSTSGFLAAQAIWELAHADLLQEVLDHPAVQESSEDEWPILVIAAATIVNPTQDKIHQLLDTARVQQRESSTEHSPMMLVSVVRTGESKPGTIDLILEMVEWVEGFMGLPLPTDHVVVVLDETAVSEGAAGDNHGVAVSFLPKYEDPIDAWTWSHLHGGMRHELAHYFWRGNEAWLDEGGASIIDSYYKKTHGSSSAQVKPRRGGCEAHDIEMLMQWAPGFSSEQFGCNYYMGELLFHDLMAKLGKEPFAAKMRELYALTLSQRRAGVNPGIDEIRQVFSDQSDIVEHYWSGKWNAPENRDMTDGIERSSHQLVQWDNLPSLNEGTNTVAFSGTLMHGAVLVASHISIARENVWNFSLCHFDSNECVGAILPPLDDAKWVLDEFPGWSVAVIYNLQGQSFSIEFPFPRKLERAQDYVVVVNGFQDAERVPAIGSKHDILGYARIR